MKKLTCVVVFTFLMMLGAIASAAGLEKDVQEVQTSFGPMLVKTLKGPELNGVNHKGLSFIKAKGKEGLQVTNSRKEKVNLIVMNVQSVKPFLMELQKYNQITEGQSEGPIYKVEVNTQKPSPQLKNKFEKIGINQPIMLKVLSDKKAKPNIWGGILAKAAFAFLI